MNLRVALYVIIGLFVSNYTYNSHDHIPTLIVRSLPNYERLTPLLHICQSMKEDNQSNNLFHNVRKHSGDYYRQEYSVGSNFHAGFSVSSRSRTSSINWNSYQHEQEIRIQRHAHKNCTSDYFSQSLSERFGQTVASFSQDICEQLIRLYHLYHVPGFENFLLQLPNIDELLASVYKAFNESKELRRYAQTFLDCAYQKDSRRNAYNFVNHLKKLCEQAGHDKQVRVQQVEQQREDRIRQQKIEVDRQRLDATTEQYTQIKEQCELGWLDDSEEKFADELEERTAGEQAAYDRHVARMDAIKQFCDGNRDTYEQSYDVSAIPSDLLGTYEIDPQMYESCTGNIVQQTVHAEFVSLVHAHTDRLIDPVFESCRNLHGCALSITEIGVGYNKLGNLINAFDCADFCWAVLTGTGAIIRGVFDGVVNTGHAITHPIETVWGMVTTTASIAYHCSKLLFNIGKIGVFKAINNPQSDEEWNAFTNDLGHFTDMIVGVYSNTTAQEKLRGATAFITETILFSRFTHAMGKYFKGINKKARENPGKTSFSTQDIASTPEGVEFMVARDTMTLMEESGQNVSGSHKPKKLTSCITRCKNHCFKELDQYFMKKLESVSGYLEKNFDVKIESIDFGHIFEGDWNPKKKRPTGGHSGWYHPEKLGEISSKPNSQGILRGRWFDCGKSKPSTIFPNNWGPHKIADKLVEALKNVAECKTKEGITRLTGITSEGVKIQMIIDSIGSLKTFYPLM